MVQNMRMLLCEQQKSDRHDCLSLLRRGREARTPVFGFGDQRSTTELFLCVQEHTLKHRSYYSRSVSLRQAFSNKICLKKQVHSFLNAGDTAASNVSDAATLFRIRLGQNTAGKSKLCRFTDTILRERDRSHLAG